LFKVINYETNSVLNFRIPTVFDVCSIELIRFRIS
jgi:hypothetical protein